LSEVPWIVEPINDRTDDAHGSKYRVNPYLNPSLAEPLRRQLERARALHENDVREGYGRVYLPYALARKYPSAGREWCWQYVFPATKRSVDPRRARAAPPHLGDGLAESGESGGQGGPGG
jgi:hypothetical protein